MNFITKAVPRYLLLSRITRTNHQRTVPRKSQNKQRYFLRKITIPNTIIYNDNTGHSYIKKIFVIQARVYQSSELNIIFIKKIRSKRSWPVTTAIWQEISKRDLYSVSPQNVKRASCFEISAWSQLHSRQIQNRASKDVSRYPAYKRNEPSLG